MELPRGGTSVVANHHHAHPADDGHAAMGSGEGEGRGNELPDMLTLTSVGIDIGSSTSHLVFSRLVLQRQGARLSSAFVVVERNILYQSPILLTPYRDDLTIDSDSLGAFVQRAYDQARLLPSEVDTGALIVTGNAAMKENAEAIARVLAAGAGRFVCASAGPHLEAQLAAHGSGAIQRSRGGRTVLNLDIGGGTTKLALVRDGQILDTAALAIGARMVAVDSAGHILRLEEGADTAAQAAGVVLEMGALLPIGDRAAVARVLAQTILSVVSERGFIGMARRLLVTEPIALPERIDELHLSGGVSEYVHWRESRDLGDLGLWLGEELRLGLAVDGVPPLGEGVEGIRATVIGAGQYTLQVSGSTYFMSRSDVLPLRDLRVLRPSLDGTDAGAVASGICRAVERHQRDGGDGEVAIALRAGSDPSYDRLREIAAGIAVSVKSFEQERPVVLIFDGDVGRSVGAILHEEFLPDRSIVVIDEVRVGEFDYVDLGSPLRDGAAVPVVVKTLVFPELVGAQP